jgi:hypothetical protein
MPAVIAPAMLANTLSELALIFSRSNGGTPSWLVPGSGPTRRPIDFTGIFAPLGCLGLPILRAGTASKDGGSIGATSAEGLDRVATRQVLPRDDALALLRHVGRAMEPDGTVYIRLFAASRPQ